MGGLNGFAFEEVISLIWGEGIDGKTNRSAGSIDS